jgi:hypothetical protein
MKVFAESNLILFFLLGFGDIPIQYRSYGDIALLYIISGTQVEPTTFHKLAG